MSTVVLGVSGSIAAYRAADLASRLTKDGLTVHVVMTREAAQFVAPITLQTLSRNPVTVSWEDERENWRPSHIALADAADLMVVAPATANVIAQFAHGLAPDPLSAIYLATSAPLLLAPAMNGKMWLHPAVQENVARLRDRGAHFIGPEEGMLACGYEGVGRLWPVPLIADRIHEILHAPQ